MKKNKINKLIAIFLSTILFVPNNFYLKGVSASNSKFSQNTFQENTGVDNFGIDSSSISMYPFNMDNADMSNKVTINWSNPFTGYDDNVTSYSVQSKSNYETEYKDISSNYGKKMNILNIYPTGGNVISSWINTALTIDDVANSTPLEDDLIKVTREISISNYNSLTTEERNKLFYDENGKGNFDAIFVGVKDGNANEDLTLQSAQDLKLYTDKGYGLLLGHDTIGYYRSYLGTTKKLNLYTVFAEKLGLKSYLEPEIKTQLSDLLGLSIETLNLNYGLYSMNKPAVTGSNSKIVFTKSGYLTNFPFVVPVGQELAVPDTHTIGTFVTTDNVWAEFSDFKSTSSKVYDDLTITYDGVAKSATNNYYIIANRNIATIQTGHTVGQVTNNNKISTAEERMLLVNLLYSLSSRTVEKNAEIRTFDDFEKPNRPNITLQYLVNSPENLNDDEIRFAVSSSDNGTDITYRVKADAKGESKISDELTIKAISGIKGFNIAKNKNLSPVNYYTEKTTLSDGDIVRANDVIVDVKLSKGTEEGQGMEIVDAMGNKIPSRRNYIGEISETIKLDDILNNKVNTYQASAVDYSNNISEMVSLNFDEYRFVKAVAEYEDGTPIPDDMYNSMVSLGTASYGKIGTTVQINAPEVSYIMPGGTEKIALVPAREKSTSYTITTEKVDGQRVNVVKFVYKKPEVKVNHYLKNSDGSIISTIKTDLLTGTLEDIKAITIVENSNYELAVDSPFWEIVKVNGVKDIRTSGFTGYNVNFKTDKEVNLYYSKIPTDVTINIFYNGDSTPVTETITGVFAGDRYVRPPENLVGYVYVGNLTGDSSSVAYTINSLSPKIGENIINYNYITNPTIIEKTYITVTHLDVTDNNDIKELLSYAIPLKEGKEVFGKKITTDPRVISKNLLKSEITTASSVITKEEGNSANMMIPTFKNSDPNFLAFEYNLLEDSIYNNSRDLFEKYEVYNPTFLFEQPKTYGEPIGTIYNKSLGDSYVTKDATTILIRETDSNGTAVDLYSPEIIIQHKEKKMTLEQRFVKLSDDGSYEVLLPEKPIDFGEKIVGEEFKNFSVDTMDIGRNPVYTSYYNSLSDDEKNKISNFNKGYVFDHWIYIESGIDNIDKYVKDKYIVGDIDKHSDKYLNIERVGYVTLEDSTTGISPSSNTMLLAVYKKIKTAEIQFLFSFQDSTGGIEELYSVDLDELAEKQLNFYKGDKLNLSEKELKDIISKYLSKQSELIQEKLLYGWEFKKSYYNSLEHNSIELQDLVLSDGINYITYVYTPIVHEGAIKEMHYLGDGHGNYNIVYENDYYAQIGKEYKFSSFTPKGFELKSVSVREQNIPLSSMVNVTVHKGDIDRNTPVKVIFKYEPIIITDENIKNITVEHYTLGKNNEYLLHSTEVKTVKIGENIKVESLNIAGYELAKGYSKEKFIFVGKTDDNLVVIFKYVPISYIYYIEDGLSEKDTVGEKGKVEKTVNEDIVINGNNQKVNDKDNQSIITDTDNHSKFISGYQDKTFRPNNSLTRAEAVQIFYNLSNNLSKYNAGFNKFADISEDSWYYNAVAFSSLEGIVNGYVDGTFKPNKDITRAEFVTIIDNIYELEGIPNSHFKDVLPSAWFYNSVNRVYEKGWTKGYGYEIFKPEANITRAEAVSIINNSLNRKVSSQVIDNIENPYIDVDKEYWAFGNIIEASVYHEYIRKEDGSEIWTLSN